jgi:hypothetical protein
VERAAPEEVPLLEATAAAYARRPARDSDELLGIGLDAESVGIVSVAALSAAQAVAAFVGTIAADAVQAEATESVRSWIGRKLRRRSPEPAELTAAVRAFEPGELARVRQIAYDAAVAAQIAPAQARLIADAIVGGLSQDPSA